MTKKRIGFLMIIFSLIAISGVFYIYENHHTRISVNYNNLLTSTNDYMITKGDKEESNTQIITGLSINDCELVYSKKTNSFYYSVNNLSELKDMIFEFTSMNYDMNDVNLYVEKKEINGDFIEKNDYLSILATKNNSYSEYKLYFTTLPIVNIYGKDLEISEEVEAMSYKGMKLVVYDNSKEHVMPTTYEGQIKIRGANSTLYPKKGFKLHFDNPLENPMLELNYSGKDYVLYANYNDHEKIRNVFCTKIWYDACASNNMFGITNGVYYKYIDLFINDEYWGLYALGFPVNESVVGVNNNAYSSGQPQENIYKKAYLGDKTELEFDFDNPQDNYYEIKTNKNKAEAWQQLSDYYNVILNSDDIEEIYNSVDINNAIDIYLFFSITQAVNNTNIRADEFEKLYNIYYTSKWDGDHIRMIVTPWDLDQTFSMGIPDLYLDFDYDGWNYFSIYNACDRLLKLGDSEIKNLIIERFNYLRINEWSDEYVLNIINNYEIDIYNSGSFLRDKDRWSYTDSAFNKNGEKLSVFREYVLNRFHFYDDNLSYFLDIQAGIGND